MTRSLFPNNNMMSTERSKLRKQMNQKRLKLDRKYKIKADTCIVNQLINHPILKSSQQIAGYCAIAGEVDLAAYFKHTWRQLKQIYLPTITDQQLLFCRYDKDTKLTANQWRTLEPITKNYISTSQLDVVLVPLVAFDKKGNRLGRGAGYYDRSFAFVKSNKTIKKPYLLGVGYAFQEVCSLTPFAWDVPLQDVITEKRIN